MMGFPFVKPKGFWSVDQLAVQQQPNLLHWKSPTEEPSKVLNWVQVK